MALLLQDGSGGLSQRRASRFDARAMQRRWFGKPRRPVQQPDALGYESAWPDEPLQSNAELVARATKEGVEGVSTWLAGGVAIVCVLALALGLWT